MPKETSTGTLAMPAAESKFFAADSSLNGRAYQLAPPLFIRLYPSCGPAGLWAVWVVKVRGGG